LRSAVAPNRAARCRAGRCRAAPPRASTGSILTSPRISVSVSQEKGQLVGLGAERGRESEPGVGGIAQHIEVFQLRRHSGATKYQHIGEPDLAFGQRPLGQCDVRFGRLEDLRCEAPLGGAGPREARRCRKDLRANGALRGDRSCLRRRERCLGFAGRRLLAMEQGQLETENEATQAVRPALFSAYH
jgi:hypothetical protein